MEKTIKAIAEQIQVLSFELLGLVYDNQIEAEKRRSQFTLVSPKRKKPKEGSITLRKDARYMGRYVMNGRQMSVYAKTYDECFKRLNAAIALRDNAPTKDYTFFAWADTFMTVYKLPKLKEATYKANEGYLRMYVKIGADMPLKSVTPMELKKRLNAVPTERTRESVYGLLSGLFRQAYAEQIISFNPMLAVPHIAAKRKKGTALTVDEQATFIKAIENHPMRLYYLFCLFTGCRRGEALAMTANDIDRTNSLLHIRGTKTDGSDHFIPLFESVSALLPLLPNHGILFDLTADNVTKTFGKLCPAHRLHDLRHTFATRCLEAGVPLKVVQSWLGHSTIDTTANIYADVLNDYSQSEAKKLKDVFHFDTTFDTKSPLNKE